MYATLPLRAAYAPRAPPTPGLPVASASLVAVAPLTARPPVVLSVIVSLCLVAMAASAPTVIDSSIRQLPALRHEEVHDEFGQYALRYITAEGTVVSERGRLVPGQNGGYVLLIEGQYEFISDDGKLYVTRYHGGPDGFHVEGTHLPQPVPVPAI